MSAEKKKQECERIFNAWVKQQIAKQKRDKK